MNKIVATSTNSTAYYKYKAKESIDNRTGKQRDIDRNPDRETQRHRQKSKQENRLQESHRQKS